jgi:phage/plasmid-like protein (TIGR03299 family)
MKKQMENSIQSERVNGRLLLNPVIEAKDLSTAVHKVKASEILNAAKVNWTVSKVPLYLPDGRVMPRTFALVRDDNKAPLSTVGSTYRPNQNIDALSAFDALVEAGYLQGYSNAGIFNGGKLVWLQAQINTFQIGPDEIKGNLTACISHGSRMTDRWGVSNTVIRCLNTFMHAADDAKTGIVAGHTKKGNEKFQDAVNKIHAAAEMLKVFQEQGTWMYNQPFTRAHMRIFAENLMPDKGDKEATPRLQGMRDSVIDLFDNGYGHFAIRGTKWAAFNAVTEYADHHRSTRRTDGNSTEDSRLASAWFGTGADLKQRALDLLLA